MTPLFKPVEEKGYIQGESSLVFAFTEKRSDGRATNGGVVGTKRFQFYLFPISDEG